MRDRRGSPGATSIGDLNNTSFRYLQETISPARRAGQLLLVHETFDPAIGERRSWQYTTGRTDSAPRVQRTSAINYDTPQIYSDAMSTADSFDVFSGPLDRFDWTVVGRGERYIAYNSYELSSPEHKYADIIKPGHINQDLVRYEKHRVWIADATLKPTQRHVYSRRTAYFDEDGYLFLSDRKRDMIIAGGVNIYPAQIEAEILECPGVVDVAVFGIPDADLGEAVCAVVAPEPGAPLTEDGLRGFLADRLARYMQPRVIVLDPEMPRDASGKVYKRKLRDRYWQETGRAI